MTCDDILDFPHDGQPWPDTGAPRPNLIRHFDQTDLARRWRVSVRTLEKWRWQRKGPAYLKIGGRVAYRIEDIEIFETGQLRGAGDDA